MRLLRLRLAHWQQMPERELEFSPGVTVVHGPNQAGKTNLFGAIRKGLFDKHKAKSDEIVAWGSPEQVPEIELEFEAAGRRFLVLKKFAKGRAGGSALWELDPTGGRRELADGADVDEEVRKLLRSSGDRRSGLPGMFWVPQGAVAVPAVDEEFAGQLRRLLDVITVTGADERVRRLLADKLSASFTPSVQKSRSYFAGEVDLARLDQAQLKGLATGSALLRAREESEGLRAELARVEADLAACEQDMLAAEDLRARLLEAAASLGLAEDELRRLEADEARVAAVRRGAEKSALALAEAEGRLTDLQHERGEYAACAAGLEACGRERSERAAGVEAAKAGRERCKAARDEAREAIKALDQKLADLRAGALVEPSRELLGVHSELARARERLERARGLEEEARDARARLAGLVVPPEKKMKRITALLARSAELTAALEAGGLRFRFLPAADRELTIAADRRGPETVLARAGKPLTRQARQELTLSIPGVGDLAFGRGEEDVDLEKTAAEARAVADELNGLLAALGIDPAGGAAEVMAELHRRRGEEESLRRKAEEKEAELDRLGGAGSAALAGDINRLAAERSNLLSAHPRLAGWEPSREALAKLQQDLAASAASIEDERAAAAARLEAAEAGLERAGEQVNEAGALYAEVEALFRIRRDEMADRQSRHPSLETLDQAVAAAAAAADGLKRAHEAMRLGPDEENFPARLQAARELVTSRREYRHGLDKDLEVLRERLRGKEGKHDQRVRLGGRIEALEREAARLEATLRAQAALAQVFDRIRDQGIERSLKPVTDLVGPWLREVQGPGAKEVIFGAGMQAEKLVTAGGESDDFSRATSLGELEQLALLVRLAYAAVLAGEEPQLIILDDPLAHTDPVRLRRMHAVIADAAAKNLQVVIFTCRRSDFDQVPGAKVIDLPTGH